MKPKRMGPPVLWICLGLFYGAGWWWELGAWGGFGKFEFFGGHVYGNFGEEWGGEVAFACVGEHGEDGRAFGGFGCDLEGSGKGGS